MKAQSCSIVVPTRGCVNNCEYCLSETHRIKYKDRISRVVNKQEPELLASKEVLELDIALNDYQSRLEYLRENQVDTLVITGDRGEPLQNTKFLDFFFGLNRNLKNGPFRKIELQTTGVFLDEANLMWLRHNGVYLISLSVANIFDSKRNQVVSKIPDKLYFDIDELCKSILEHKFVLRFSMNMIDDYNMYNSSNIYSRLTGLGVSQVTFRKLYSSDNDTEEDKWIERNRAGSVVFDRLDNYILGNWVSNGVITRHHRENRRGNFMGPLSFGGELYDVHGISSVVDNDCMNIEGNNKEEFRYLILRPDCHLYPRWEYSSIFF